MDPSQPPEISSLIRLLDDRDSYVTDRVGDRLVEWGTQAVPLLEVASRGENPTLKSRALEILERLAPLQLAEDFRELTKGSPGEEIDLEQGVLLLMRFGHPSASPRHVRQQLDTLAEGLAPRITPKMPAAQVVDQLTDYLFHQQGFHGNQDNYSDPDNSYFDSILKNKTGLPITLSVLCMLIGQRLQLPIVGISLPYHFVVQYNSADPILFDPFHKGRLLTPEKCSEMVQGFGVNFEPEFLAPVNHREIMARMIQNLAIAYQKLGEEDKVESLEGFSKILTVEK